jgi:hypothetical protein
MRLFDLLFLFLLLVSAISLLAVALVEKVV